MCTKAVLSAIAVALTAVPAWSQTVITQSPEQPRCWLGSIGFSPGATIRAADSVMICTPAFTWEATTKAAAGCAFDGKLYGVGAIQQGFSQSMPSVCRPDGTWILLSAVSPTLSPKPTPEELEAFIRQYGRQ